MALAARDTGLQVVHTLSALVTAQTTFADGPRLLGVLPPVPFIGGPVASLILSATCTVGTAFAPGQALVLNRTPVLGAQMFASFDLSATGTNIPPTVPISAADAIIGGPIYYHIFGNNGAGNAIVVVTFIPKLG